MLSGDSQEAIGPRDKALREVTHSLTSAWRLTALMHARPEQSVETKEPTEFSTSSIQETYMFKNIIAVAIIAAFSSAAFAEATPTAPAKPVEAAKTVAATPAPAAAEAAKPQVKPEEAKEAAKVEKKAKHKVKKAVEAPAAATTEAAPAAAKPATTAVKAEAAKTEAAIPATPAATPATKK